MTKTTNTDNPEFVLTVAEQDIFSAMAVGNDDEQKNMLLRFTYEIAYRNEVIREHQLTNACGKGFLKEIVKDFGAEVGEKLFRMLQVAIVDYGDCFNDNWRYCKVGHTPSEKLYREMHEKGCCGYYDDKVVINGDTYKIGFNFGH